jgi:predicted GNAT family acetyltransferase
MAWHPTDDVDEFHAAAGEFLRSRPVEHTVPLTLLDTVRTRGLHAYGPGDPHFGFWESSGAVTGAFLQTPPFPLVMTAMPAEAVPALVTLLAGRPLPGVNALATDAEVFADAWHRLTGATVTQGRRTRLFRLDTLVPPAPHPPGKARVAVDSDRELLVRWLEGFHRDVGEALRDGGVVVDEKLAYGGLTLWEVDGEPVSMAGASRMESGMVRVMAVYTPRALRGRGYAGAATAAVTRAALDAGADDVVLFTDLANPTSNALYQRLGYRPIEDRVVMEFPA